jgi:hypothetical protein
MSTIFAIDGAEFGDFGAASQSIVALQNGLKALGQGVGDNILRAIVVDGLIGPKTTAATNRALTVHVGEYQAPATLRTGSLSQAQVVANADALAQIINTEAQRRGYNVPTGQVIATMAKVAAAKPVVKTAPMPVAAVATRAPQSYSPAPAGDDFTSNIIKYSAIGLGVVVAAAGIYWTITRKGGRSAMAGFGSGGYYQTDPKAFRKGMRVGLHPGLDQWMRGDRYGEVTKTGKKLVHIKTDHGFKMRLPASRLEIID